MRLSRVALLATTLAALPAALVAHGIDAAAAQGRFGWPSQLAAVGLAISAALYITALKRRAPLQRKHVAAFATGWSALVIALLSPLDTAAAGSFAWHMVQHQLLMVLAPPLLILGRPFVALAAVLPARALRIVAWPLRMPPLGAWLLHAAALWIWHVPRLFDAAIASPGVHALQHASFFFTALLFWWAVFRRVSTGTAAFYVLTTMIHCGALAALLTFAPHALYGDTALRDQQAGGLIMWVPAGYALLLAGLLVFDRLLKRSPA